MSILVESITLCRKVSIHNKNYEEKDAAPHSQEKGKEMTIAERLSQLVFVDRKIKGTPQEKAEFFNRYFHREDTANAPLPRNPRSDYSSHSGSS